LPAENASAQTLSVGALAQQQAQQPVQVTKKAQSLTTVPANYAYFPCGPRALQSWWIVNARRNRSPYSSQYLNPYPWQWVVCHSGSWIHHGRGFAWVAGRHRHHHPPVKWVKVNGKLAFVPAHPRDERGKAPLNAKFGLFTVKSDPEKGVPVERLNYDPGAKLKVLASIPKEFDKPYFEPLQPIEAPKVEARLANDELRLGRPAHWPTTPITFDHKTQSFVTSYTVLEAAKGGAKRVTISQPLGGGPSATHSAGSFASHGGGGFSGGGGSGGGGGHVSGGSSGGSGGASHSGGGGFSGGGGASHGGGGSSAPSGGGGGGSAPSGGGASHH
jgi:hypothetical protein